MKLLKAIRVRELTAHRCSNYGLSNTANRMSRNKNFITQNFNLQLTTAVVYNGVAMSRWGQNTGRKRNAPQLKSR